VAGRTFTNPKRFTSGTGVVGGSDEDWLIQENDDDSIDE